MTETVDLDKLYQGLALPLNSGPDGVWTLRGTKAVIRSQLRMVLLTIPGERRMNPKFGSRLTELVGEPNNFVLASLARIYTVDAIRANINAIEISTVRTFAEVHDFTIQIGYWIIPIKQPDLLSLTLPRRL